MKDLLKIIGFCILIGVIYLGLVYLYGLWAVNKTAEALEDFEESYNDFLESTENSLELVGDVTLTSSGSYGYYTYYIEGILKNVSGEKLDYAQVSFAIYDTDGNNIGSAFDNINYIDAGGTWKFKATYFGEEPYIKYSAEPEITSW